MPKANQHNKARTLVDVAVHPALREYILCINQGSDIIIPDKYSRLWGLLRMHLDLVPPDYKPTPVEGNESSIRIALFTSFKKSWSIPAGKTIVVNTLFRDYLPPKGQRAIASHLMKEFKNTFRAYMSGALSNNPDLNIVDAVNEFCDDYQIHNESITVGMLLKDWYRYRQKFCEGSPIPIQCADL